MEHTLPLRPAILPVPSTLHQMRMGRSTCTWLESLLENILGGEKDQLFQQQKTLVTLQIGLIVQLMMWSSHQFSSYFMMLKLTQNTLSLSLHKHFDCSHHFWSFNLWWDVNTFITKYTVKRTSSFNKLISYSLFTFKQPLSIFDTLKDCLFTLSVAI